MYAGSPEPFELTPAQQAIVDLNRAGGERLWVSGIAGTGKSTALAARLAALLREGHRPYEVLVLLPQRAQADRYEDVLRRLDAPTRGGVDITTFYALSRRAVDLYWPAIAEDAGFARPDRDPVFLTIESTEYHLWRIVEPLVAKEGYFSSISVRRERLLSQLIDNLNKSALVGFDHTTIYDRLRGAWTGSPDHLPVYQQAQECASRFREYCLANNLVDFSLSVALYSRHVLPLPAYRENLRYRHLLADNVEESVPVAQDMIRWLMPQCASAVICHDRGGGLRTFLGADPEGALALSDDCTRSLVLDEPLASPSRSIALAEAVLGALHLPVERAARADGRRGRDEARQAIVAQGGGRFWISEMRWVADRVAELIAGGARPNDIGIIGPYISEVMRFAIEDELTQRGIAVRLLRPSSALRDDAVVRGLLMLALLAHPDWSLEVQESRFTLQVPDVALALQTALAGLDPVRARVLAKSGYVAGDGRLADLSGGEEAGALVPAAASAAGSLARLWEQVGFQLREPYERLREWLDAYRDTPGEPLDMVLSALFGELLSQPGFRFCDDPEGARAYGRLVESATKFLRNVPVAAGGSGDVAVADRELSRQYVELILSGIASADYMADWPGRWADEAVLFTPAYTFLTRDVRVRYQFWVDLGDPGWWNRPNQPLTQPYVLSRRWPIGQPWRDIEEDQARREALGRVVLGLAARCDGDIYLAWSELGIAGEEQDTRLQRVIQRALAEGVDG